VWYGGRWVIAAGTSGVLMVLAASPSTTMMAPGARPGSDRPGAVYGVSCVAPAEAWAVGWAGPDESATQTLILRWDGSNWRRTPAPHPGSESRLTSVNGSADDDVWAVGQHLASSTTPAGLVLRWDGSGWHTERVSPEVGRLWLSVSSDSPSDVWVTGTNSLYSETYIEHFDGHTWSALTPANPGKPYVLDSITALSPDDVWAVGYTGTAHRTLVEHWNGTDWQIVKSPNGSSATRLNGVAGSSDSDLWAVGRNGGTGGGGRGALTAGPRSIPRTTIGEHYDGKRWALTGTISPDESELQSVADVSADDVWAVGDSIPQTQNQTLTELWDGSGWANVNSPTPPKASASLTSVSGCAPDDVWAAGFALPAGSAGSLTWIQHWNGNGWTKR
jgi:hypothetical protein